MKHVTPVAPKHPDIRTISRVVLDDDDAVTRRPPRAEASKQKNYDELFDDRTIVCDVFRTPRGVEVVAPPPLNLREDARILAKVGQHSTDLFDAGVQLDRTFIASLPFHGEGLTQISLSLAESSSRVTVPIQSDESHHFEGQHVVVTQQQDNDLDVLAEWIRFYREIHGFTAFIIYDNASVTYDVAALTTRVRAAHPDIVLATIEWSVPFGVTGGPDQCWDSDYGQHAAWEHARRRFLRLAKSAIFVDVDELVVSESGAKLADTLAGSDGGAFRLNRFDMSPSLLVNSDMDRHRRHTDFLLRPEAPRLVNTKPGVLLEGLPESAQIRVHDIKDASAPVLDDFVVRHFLGLRLDWRNGRQRYSYPDVYAMWGEEGLIVDRDLYRDFLTLRRG